MGMSALEVGCARVDEQDLTAQRDGLTILGVEPKRIYVDHGLTGHVAIEQRQNPAVDRRKSEPDVGQIR